MNTHASAQLPLPLEKPQPDGRTFLNASVWFVDSDGYRVVFRWHEPIYRVALTDEVHLRLVAVALRQSGLATARRNLPCLRPQRSDTGSLGTAVPQACHRRLGVQEAQRTRSRVGQEPRGLCSPVVPRGILQPRDGQAVGSRRGHDPSDLEAVGVGPQACRLCGCCRRSRTRAAEIADAENASATPWSNGRSTRTAETPSPAVSPLPSPSPKPCEPDAAAAVESPVVPSFTLDRDPHDRSGDRVLARLGLLEDAVPLFADHACLPHAGVLLAVPLLVRHGLIETFAKVYGSLRPGVLRPADDRGDAVSRRLVADQASRALERIRSVGPGRDHGVGPCPEVKTVRRKFTRLAAMGQGKQLMDELARRRIAARRGPRGVSVSRRARAGIPREIPAVCREKGPAAGGHARGHRHLGA